MMVIEFIKRVGNSIAWRLRRFLGRPEMDMRTKIAKRYISGSGIEIGALHQPLRVAKDVNVRYVDRMGVEDLRRHYPELKDAELVNVDIIDNGELLSKIADTSLDFIISNHMLEHCQNPLGTIRNHLGKLKPGGIIYMAIPDKRFSFDRNRQLTSFEHIVTDYKSGADCSRAGHFLEWSKFCNNLNGEDAAIRSKKLMEMDYSIHYHVWDYYSFSDFLNKAQEYLCNSFNVKFIAQNKHEIIAVITKPHT